MSLYREARKRSLWSLIAVGVAGVAIGVAIGLLVAPAEKEPTLEESVAALGERLAPAASALELVTIEYPQAFAGGETGGASELDAALSQAETARSTVADNEGDIAALDAAESERLTEMLDELVAAIEAEEEPPTVKDLATESERAIDGLTGEAT